ncbi:hypothetical protein MAR_020849 [Mya arenaria]|uniref:Uncharacterized protein n=1 Tax=Mya arenaria TaxID=6604 RepID=A0ABY7E623_MYAAR|nr:hypothetical protein MAR_020849 [Mya arenaria]
MTEAKIDSEGFPGIGRTRVNSDEENLKLLKKEIAMGTKEEDDDGDDDFSIWKIAVIVVCSLLAMNIIGVVVYCCVNKRKHDARDVAQELSSNAVKAEFFFIAGE